MTIANIYNTPFTKNYASTSVTFSSDYGFKKLSILCTTGTISITGGRTSNGVASDAVTLSSGQSVTFGGSDSPILDGIEIDATGGAAAVVAE